MEVLLPNFQSYSIFLSLLLFIFIFSIKSSGNETDRLALLSFKERISQDPLDVMSSWNDSLHHCYWRGVSCSKRHPGRVTLLNLGGKQLAGTLPPHIGNLSFLSGINLTTNFFQGEIPREMGRLSRLKHLNLSTNGFQGNIPTSLSNCSNLQVINLNYNKLVGEIPFELSSLATKNLKGFYFGTNNLTGRIPAWLGNTTSLIGLTLAGNNFNGTIPSELGRLANLTLLQLGINQLSGTVPPTIYNISSLQYLDIGINRLTGRIPSEVGSTLFNLIGLYVADNYFSGSIPLSLSNASRLEELNFSSNNFTGTVPPNLGNLKDLRRLTFYNNNLKNEEGEEFDFITSLTNCSKLQLLDIQTNMFRGELPSSVANFSGALSWLAVGTNQISGSIPEGIEALVGLQYLLFYDNNFTGEIPSGIGKLKKLKFISLFNNRISGAIPSSLGNITQLLRIQLYSNNLEGNIPSSLGNCQQLEVLDLYGNALTGAIPIEIASLTSLTLNFNLGRNFLTGVLPPEVGNMSRLVEFDISGNRLSGEIPSSIGRCEMLERLRLGDNLLQGNIPSTLSSLKSIKAIDLSENNLSGEIPTYLRNLTLLKYLNLSYNNLEGQVPQEGIFRNQGGFSIVGNVKLCGGSKSLGLQACQVDRPKRKRISLALKIAIPLAISCSILLASLYFAFIWKKKKRVKSSPDDLLDERFPKVSYAELSKATNGFSSSNLIGRGGHGSVFRGILSNNGMNVAVKVLNLTQKGAAKSFIRECNALKNIRHRNLLRIITACSSIDFKGSDFKALVFELMPNGSLEEWLHQGEITQNSLENLSLTQRLSIAIDIACALEYLHHQCEIPVVHGDLKPSNILLDREMTAHVGDFGLARVLSNLLDASSSQNPMISTGVKGTIGYVAPEYGMGGMLSLEGDIYSFGVMMLEIFTGIKPTDDIFMNGMDLHQYAKMALPERVTEVVEPTILSNVEDNGNNSNSIVSTTTSEMVEKVVECVAALLRIGVSCSMESPGERMNMKDVVAEMNKIKDKYISSIRNRNGGYN